MDKLQDRLVKIGAVTVAEAFLLATFAPNLRPAGGTASLTVLVFAANLILYYLFCVLVYPYYFSRLRHLPGPKGGNLFTGWGLRLFLAVPPGDLMREWVEEYDNDGLVRFRDIDGGDGLILSSPAALKSVLVDNAYNYQKHPNLASLLRDILGDGLILVEGNAHRFQRKHLNSSFQVNIIRDLHPVFWRKAHELTQVMRDLTAEPEVEFGEWCTRVTLDIIGLGIGHDFNCLKNPDNELVKCYLGITQPTYGILTYFIMSVFLTPRVVKSIPFWSVPRELNVATSILHDFAANLARERRAELNDPKLSAEQREARNDILSHLVKSNDFGDAELANQILTFMAAGHETTSNTICWALFCLLNGPPGLIEDLRAEIRAALPPPSTHATTTLNAADIDRLPLLHGVCQETLRLYPVVPVTQRNVAVDGTDLLGHKLPLGQEVLICPWAINRLTKLWGPDAMEFRPERWLNADGKVNNHGGASNNYDFMTFLHGPRSCIGQGFAKAELKCLVAAIVGKYDFELTRDKSLYFPAGIITTKPANGMWLKFTEVPGW